ncbi:nucleoside triphosphate pyrophosphohydrolase [Fonticella tunisiensis]|uniref:Putative house-cleaning noncanonical NTP pyrophosphatase (MazG superfamily) n=1 Tax=Fonticella tunisiensis TaxID=1096341 RepID=A0A4R7KRB9_9CLOT|nr:nucleoside triphosphate pyrophosphohydrolase [Fonticella tunisiensis]TDT61153.1 putative house-cleaning noncanonical NTP pyrophosphatase (MazG superfamily) [Fonticella tunisiensis]
MRKEYYKIIRDRIPNIIEAEGKQYKTKILSGDRLLKSLNEKLCEELEEYKKSGSIEELVDIIEVIYGILKSKGISLFEFEEFRRKKLIEKGGFQKGIFLEYVDE